MKQILLFISFLFVANLLYSQQSDFIVLKKKNNRTLRTYYPGAFISAVTVSDFPINGFIMAIRNDSLIIRQEERKLMQTEFGMALDTFVYIIAVDYRQIKQFNYTRAYTWGGKRGFVQVALPKIMILGGGGFVVLETVNTIYRGESFNDDKKLVALGVAAGIAAAGWFIEHTKARNKKVGKKYKVVYVKAKSA
jgi:hypothetical protein